MADAHSSAGVANGSAAGPELGFDQILARLREVVVRLESGDLSLEQSLMIYEEGVQLARRGQQLLAGAERRVEILVSASGGIEVEPFNDERSEAAGSGDSAGGTRGSAPRGTSAGPGAAGVGGGTGSGAG